MPRSPLPAEEPGAGSLAAALPDLDREFSLLELADRLLDRGVVAAGEATISVAGVDLVYLGLNLVLTAVENLQRPAGPGASPGARVSAPASTGGKPPRSGRAPARGESAQSAPVQGSTDSPRTAPASEAPPVALPQAQDEQAVRAVGPAAESASTIAGPDLPPLVPARVNVEPETVEQGLAKLVLTIIELLRQLLDRQAIRRMEGGSLTDEEVERMGLALMRLEEKVMELAEHFGLRPEELNLRLGPLGRLL